MLPATINSKCVLAVTSYGVAAAPLLRGRNQGLVIAVFDSSFYIDVDGHIACIVGDDVPPGPLNVAVSLPKQTSWLACGLERGDRVSVANGSILVGQSFEFDSTRARIWKPPPSSTNWNQDTLRQGLAALRELFQSRAPAHSFARLMLQSSEHEGLSEIDTRMRERLKALRSTDVLASGSCADDQRLKKLIGLGEGLTPSGDDFLGGVMIALRAVGQSKAARKIHKCITPVALEQTNRISLAHLDCASQGFTSLPLQKLLNAILCGRSVDIAQLAEDIDLIGHTSGWDIAAGMAFALGSIANEACSQIGVE